MLNSSEFEVTGFGNTLGKQTLTVTYLDKTAYLTIQLLDANIAALNKLYETSSTTSELTTAQIGSYAGDFTLEHTVKINSIPANGNTDKNNAAGFFVRFMADKQTGGGWYLTKKSDTELNVAWKNTRASSVGTIKLGETYTFRYNFTNVGNGNGATVTLTVIVQHVIRLPRRVTLTLETSPTQQPVGLHLSHTFRFIIKPTQTQHQVLNLQMQDITLQAK